MLDAEGRRCWTLEYAEQDGVGFHLDILPAIPDPREHSDLSIAITNKKGAAYSWSVSNPRGYGTWFDGKNAAAFEQARVRTKAGHPAAAPHTFTKASTTFRISWCAHRFSAQSRS